MATHRTPWREFTTTGSVGSNITPAVPATGLTERQEAVAKFDLATLVIDRAGREEVRHRDGWQFHTDRRADSRTWLIRWDHLAVTLPGTDVDAALREVLEVGRQRELAHAWLRRHVLEVAGSLGLDRRDFIEPAVRA